MAARAKHLALPGRAALFIRIEDIEAGFETAFDFANVDYHTNHGWRWAL